MYLESVTDVKIIHQTVSNEVVDSTIRVVDFVGGDIDNPEIKDYPKLVFVDVRVWTQLKMSDIQDVAE